MAPARIAASTSSGIALADSATQRSAAVAGSLRSEPATAALRCVALSANAMPDDVEAAMRAGAMAYWTKPIDFPAFVSQVAALLGRS